MDKPCANLQTHEKSFEQLAECGEIPQGLFLDKELTELARIKQYINCGMKAISSNCHALCCH